MTCRQMLKKFVKNLEQVFFYGWTWSSQIRWCDMAWHESCFIGWYVCVCVCTCVGFGFWKALFFGFEIFPTILCHPASLKSCLQTHNVITEVFFRHRDAPPRQERFESDLVQAHDASLVFLKELTGRNSGSKGGLSENGKSMGIVGSTVWMVLTPFDV